ncbi:MAG: hypothetical protein ACK5QX_08690, partial [bacterium]
ILQVSVLGLALTYFVSAFKIIDIPYKEDDIMDFKDLLALSITPKVLWISCAVSLFGFFVMTQELGNDGYLQGFRVGMLCILISVVIHVYATFGGTKYLEYVRHIFYRAVPILVLDLYVLFG